MALDETRTTRIDIGSGLHLDVDPNAFGADHLNPAGFHAWRIGMRNILMDSHANVTLEKFPNKDDWYDAKLVKAHAKLDAMLRGEITVRGAGPREASDPIGAEALVQAKAALKGKYKKGEEDAWKAALAAKAAEPGIRALAALIVEQRAELAREIEPADLPDAE